MSENEKKGLHVYEAITAVTLEMSKEGISKDRKNQQQGYSFRGIDDVYNALSPVLSKNKLCIMPKMIERNFVERATLKGGVLFYVTVKAEFDFVSAVDGSMHTVVTYGEAMDSADKATNKAMSAAYKYAAFQTFCIPTEGDNDADATTPNVRADTADLWPVAEQETWYTAAKTLFSGDASVETLFAWGSANGNEKRIAAFHDEKRADDLGLSYRNSLVAAAQYDIDDIDGLQELGEYWKKHAIKLKNRTGNAFKDIEQAKDTRKAQLNASA